MPDQDAAAHEPLTRIVTVERGKRGYVARKNNEPHLISPLFAFDRITDLATWLTKQFPDDVPAPSIAAADPDPCDAKLAELIRANAECASVICDQMDLIAELQAQIEAFIPGNINLLTNLPNELVIPLDVKLGELRGLFAAVALAKSFPRHPGRDPGLISPSAAPDDLRDALRAVQSITTGGHKSQITLTFADHKSYRAAVTAIANAAHP